MGRKAVIDIGTNSIKFILAEMGKDGLFKTLVDKNNIAKLGEGLKETGLIGPEAMRRNCDAIKEFATEARTQGAEEIFAVGTMALRSAKNSAEFLAMVKSEAGLDIRVIPGEEEARYSYLAVVSGIELGKGKLCIIDTGGGSTEFVFGEGDDLGKRFSLELGAIRITEDYLKADPVSHADVEAALGYIDKFLASNGVGGKVDKLVGMGGGITSMGAVMFEMAEYDPDRIQGSFLSLKEVDRQVAVYSEKTIEQRRSIVGLQPKRADVILASALIVKKIMERLEVPGLTISDRGLRHGLLYNVGKAGKR